MSAEDDKERHKTARRRGYPHAIFLAPSLYESCVALGFDMTCYVKQRPIPSFHDRADGEFL